MKKNDKAEHPGESEDRPARSDATEHISWTERLWPRQPESTPTRKPASRRLATGRPVTTTTEPNVSPKAARRTAKKAIERLDPQETRLSFAAAAASAVLGVLVYVLEVENKVHFTKSPDAPVTTLVLALACGVLLLAATVARRRALVGFAALFAFLIFGTSSFVLGLPFLALAAWLLYRSYKIQKEASERTRQSSTASGSASKTSSRARPSRTSASPTPTARAKTNDANKRYTPKRPPPKATRPSGRARKSTQTSD